MDRDTVALILINASHQWWNKRNGYEMLKSLTAETFPTYEGAGREIARVQAEAIIKFIASYGWSQETTMDLTPDHLAEYERRATMAERERCARVAETAPAECLHMWDRPGGPPGNGWRRTTGADIAKLIRADR